MPYGTLLCVSDKPLHGEIKLPGQANRFYEGAISEHLQIGIRAIDLLRAEGDRLHSRKLRTFNEPPFRNKFCSFFSEIDVKDLVSHLANSLQ